MCPLLVGFTSMLPLAVSPARTVESSQPCEIFGGRVEAVVWPYSCRDDATGASTTAAGLDHHPGA